MGVPSNDMETYGTDAADESGDAKATDHVGEKTADAGIEGC